MTRSDQTPTARALDAICTQQWAITEEALRTVVAIASRANETPESLRAVLAERGEPLRNTERVVVRDGVAIVPIIGPIFRYANLFTAISGATSIDVLANDFAAAVRDAAIKAIVLEIDSPGGMVAGVSELAEQIRAATATKPVIAYVSDIGASAAYWLASAADELVIRDTARVGSIGVVMQVQREQNGAAVKFVSSQSPRKQANPDSEAGQRDYGGQVDALAGVFVASVARYRGVSTETVLSDFGQGAVLVGSVAVAVGMADRLGSLESIIAGLAGSNTPRGHRMNDKTQPPAITTAFIAAEHPAIADAFRKEGATTVTLEPEAVTLEMLRAKHPDIVAALTTEGAVAECARIQAVQAIALPGHEQLVATLMFDGKTSGDQAAAQILAAEKAIRIGQLGAIQGDGNALEGKVPATPPVGGGSPPQASVEEQCKADWDRDKGIRDTHLNLAVYTAYRKAIATGQVKVTGNRI